MATPHGIVRVHWREHTVTFQVEGRGTMVQSQPLRRVAEQSLADGAQVFHVDLRRCTHMDSTFIGTLLVLKRTIDRRPRHEFQLVCPSKFCDRIFEQMGLTGVFAVTAADEPPAVACTELPADLEDPCAFKRNVLQAHQELANLPGPAGEPFRAVVRCLAQDPEARRLQETDPAAHKPAGAC
jgi:anti-anti-sigma regulatory factor